MVVMLIFTSILAAFGLFEVLAYRYGTESRHGFDERFEHGHRRNV
jgi:hypothetical protein